MYLLLPFLASILNLNNIEIFFNFKTQYFNFFIIAFLFFIVGFIDDKKNISPNSKTTIFFILILIVINIDPKLNVTILDFSFTDNIIIITKFFTYLYIFLSFYFY